MAARKPVAVPRRESDERAAVRQLRAFNDVAYTTNVCCHIQVYKTPMYSTSSTAHAFGLAAVWRRGELDTALRLRCCCSRPGQALRNVLKHGAHIHV